MIIEQHVANRYAVYCGDSIEVMHDMPDNSVHLVAYSPPFSGESGGLFNYSSSPHDLSNCKSMEEFLAHYEFLVAQIKRVLLPGRMTAVHCMDTPGRNGDSEDFPGEVIRLHKKLRFTYHARYAIWKEPLRVAIRTRSKALTHRQLVKDATWSGNAGADYLLVFRNAGENPVPIEHLKGLLTYVGEREVPETFTVGSVTRTRETYLNWDDPQTNKLAHWIWQQYASSFWDDIRIERTLPYKAARDKDDEKHIHPLQLDVIERLVLLFSNPDETVLTPFMGVGSEVVGALMHERKAIGIDLKVSYYRQACRNIVDALSKPIDALNLFEAADNESDDDNTTNEPAINTTEEEF